MAIKTKGYEQFAVIGLGKFGAALTKALYNLGKDVLAIDLVDDKVSNVREFSTHTITADASDVNVLRELGITNFDVVIVAIGENMQANILVTMMCKEMGIPYIIAKAQNNIHKTVLEKIGADLVIVPEEDMAVKLATTLTNPGLNDLMGLTENYSIVETGIPSSWDGKNLTDLNLRGKYNINLLMIKRGSEVLTPPQGDTVLQAGDKLISGGMNDDLRRFSEKITALSKDE